MQPNILFLVIDSFRADKFSGSNKSSLTPNLDKLVQNGTFFDQAISSADGTLLSWSSMLTGLHPFKTGIRSEKLNKINPNIKTSFDILEEQGYHFYGHLPSLSKTVGIFPEFENNDSYFDYYLTCSKGLGNKILKMLESNLKNPWFIYLHIEDLHFPITIPDNVNDIKYGLSNFDKSVSNLDIWIGKFLEKINLDETIVILTADHGSYLTSITHNDEQISLEVNPSLQTAARNVGKNIPQFLNPIKSKAFFALEKIPSAFLGFLTPALTVAETFPKSSADVLNAFPNSAFTPYCSAFAPTASCFALPPCFPIIFKPSARIPNRCIRLSIPFWRAFIPFPKVGNFAVIF